MIEKELHFLHRYAKPACSSPLFDADCPKPLFMQGVKKLKYILSLEGITNVVHEVS